MTGHMTLISKPHLVDLLRIFDKNRWIIPRIRYASVRSKPELIDDLKQHFLVGKSANRLEFWHRTPSPVIPKIEYDLKARKYLLDGRYYDVPKESRKRPEFSISHVPVTLDFSCFYGGPPDSHSPPSTRRASDASEESPELGTQSRQGDSTQSEPSSPSACTPRSTPSYPIASEAKTPANSPKNGEPASEGSCNSRCTSPNLC